MATTYQVGLGKQKISSRNFIGFNMQGFAEGSQIARSISRELYSRCYTIAEAPGAIPIVLVVADIWSCTIALKKRVVDRLRGHSAEYLQLYFDENVQIMGTHTHSGPAGYSDAKLYNVTTGGFNEQITSDIVQAIFESIVKAHESRQPMSIALGRGTVDRCGGNRSLGAYLNNPLTERDKYGDPTDREMTLLSFIDQHEKVRGTLNWYPIHPTDLGQHNTGISGDSKGIAAEYYEQSKAATEGIQSFVAGFATSNAGDVSGNVDYGMRPDGTHDQQHAEEHARKQFVVAQELEKAVSRDPTRFLSGRVRYTHSVVDMANVTFMGVRWTTGGAVGLSTLAGSTEDSDPGTGLREGITRDNISSSEALFLEGVQHFTEPAELNPSYINPVLAVLQLVAPHFGGLYAKHVSDLTLEQVDAHGPKPVAIVTDGIAPNRLPVQLFTIGELAIAGIPAEFTTMAGRHLKEWILDVFKATEGNSISSVVLSGYANGYSQYVTTPYEYNMQHYEGASTLFGPGTLVGYEISFRNLILNNWKPKQSTEVPSFPDIDAFSTLPYSKWAFRPVYQQSDPGDGIAGWDLKSSADRVFAFDYESSGKLDHLVLYRPGRGGIFIVKNSQGNFTSVYGPIAGGNGIGGWDLMSSADRAFAFDYESSGKLDYLVLYRPGKGAITILKRSGRDFTSVYSRSDSGDGIGGWDLKSSADRAFAFDYDGSGKLDHLVLYRPGKGAISILKNSGGTFTAVYGQTDPGGHGIGGWDLQDAADRVFAFDYESSGKLDHLVLYRPGQGAIFIVKTRAAQFMTVYHQADPGDGIGGWDLKSAADRAFAFDYDGSGKLDHLVLYRPGKGAIVILNRSDGKFTPVYSQSDPGGNGIGGWDLKKAADRMFAFDHDGSLRRDHLVLYRPGTGAIFIVKRGGLSA